MNLAPRPKGRPYSWNGHPHSWGVGEMAARMCNRGAAELANFAPLADDAGFGRDAFGAYR